jgi:hypothetical protein
LGSDVVSLPISTPIAEDPPLYVGSLIGAARWESACLSEIWP